MWLVASEFRVIFWFHSDSASELDMDAYSEQGVSKFYFLPLDSYGWVITVVEGHIYG